MTTPRWLRWTLLGLLVVGLAWGVGRALQARKTQQASAVAAAARLAAPPVYELPATDTLTLAPVTLVQDIEISGTVKAQRSAVVKARAPGELRDLVVREGDRVRAGALLARIDNSDATARVRQAGQQAQAAQAQVAIAQRQFDNNQALVDQGFISRTALDTSQANLDAAKANHSAALAALDIARKGLSDTEVRAPIAGQVAARTAQNGERVALDARILDIVDLGALEVEAALTPAQALTVREGQRAELRIEGTELRVGARVARISPAAQTGSRSVLVYLQLDDMPGLRQGLFVQGRLQVGERQALAVPLTAVRQDKPQPYVQLLRDGRVAHQTVTLGSQGLVGGEEWVAAEPLSVGTRVLRVGAGPLREGTAVTLKNAP